MYADTKNKKDRLSRKSGRFNSVLEFGLHKVAKKKPMDKALSSKSK